MTRIKAKNARSNESGYALVLVMFFLAVLIISMAAAAPTVLSSVQREREAEMVWRGKQYTRGIRMYYLKMNRFPTSLDDLTKPKTGIRFMRQAYKDPMNQADGSWRLIYVGPNGQLIGSLSDRSIGLTGMGTPAAGGMAAAGSLLSNSSGQGFGASANSMNSSGIGAANQGTANNQVGAVTTALASSTVGSNQNATSADPNAPPGDSSGDMSQPHSLGGMMDSSNTIGGNIIGVGSKINKKSFLVYEKAKNYRQFEFIWDPSKDMTAGRASTGIGTPIQNMNGTNPAGAAGTTNSPFSTGMNPNQNQNQNQTQNPSQNQGLVSDPNQNPPLQAPPQ